MKNIGNIFPDMKNNYNINDLTYKTGYAHPWIKVLRFKEYLVLNFFLLLNSILWTVVTISQINIIKIGILNVQIIKYLMIF